MLLKRSIVILLLLALWAGPLMGQEAAPAPAQDPVAAGGDKEESEKIRRDATALLIEVADEGGRMRLVENRVFVQTSAANLMWDTNEKAARELFRLAMADVRSLYLNRTDEDVDGSRKYRRQMEAGVLRQNLLITMARRDPKTARTFLRETHDLATNGGSEAYGPYGNDDQLELSLAIQIARNDPEQALEIGRQSLAKGFSPTVVSVAEAINRQSPETAAKLVGETIAKLKNTNLNQEREAGALAFILFQKGIPPTANGGRSKETEKPAPPLVDEAGLRDLAEMITQAALNAAADDYTFSGVSSVLTQLEKYAPARVAQLRRKQGASPAAEADVSGYGEFLRLRNEGNIEEFIAAAEKPENAESKGMFYDAAVGKLIASGEIDRARRLVSEKVTEPELRNRLSQIVEQGALEQAAAKGNLDESRRLLGNVRSNEERIMTLAQLALAVAAKDRKAALLLLEEASSMSSMRSRNTRQLLARLALVRAYAVVEPERAFHLLEGSVDQANELLAALFLLGEFIGEDEVVRDDEATIFQLGRMFDSELKQYRPTVSALAQADFKRMKGVADRFQRSEVRLMARLMVAQSVLMNDEDEEFSISALPASMVDHVD